jgi:hypothetical protein
MNKKYYLVILAIVFFFWWTNKAKAAPRTTPPAPATPPTGYSPPYVWNYWDTTVLKGDTLYKLCDQMWDYAPRYFAGAGEKTREKVLKWALQNAVANGFKKELYDNIPSRNVLDPDTLKVGQKIVLYTWNSFYENNPKGIIAPNTQMNAFNSYDKLVDFEEEDVVDPDTL